MKTILGVITLLVLTISGSVNAQVDPCSAYTGKGSCSYDSAKNEVTIKTPMENVVDTMNSTVLAGAKLRLNNYKAKPANLDKLDAWYLSVGSKRWNNDKGSWISLSGKKIKFDLPHIHRGFSFIKGRKFYSYYVNTIESATFEAREDTKEGHSLNVGIAMESKDYELIGHCQIARNHLCDNTRLGLRPCVVGCWGDDDWRAPNAHWNNAAFEINFVPIPYGDSVALHAHDIHATGNTKAGQKLPTKVAESLDCFKQVLLNAARDPVLDLFNSKDLQQKEADQLRLSIPGVNLKAMEAHIEDRQLIVTYAVTIN